MTSSPRARIIGIGARLRRDDAIGPALVDRIRALHPEADAITTPLDPMALAIALEGARAAVIVDAAQGGGAPGDILRFDLGGDSLPPDPPPSSTHAAGLAHALAFARAAGRLPERVVVYAMVGGDFGMGEGLDADAEARLEELMRRVLAEAEALGRRPDRGA